MTTSSAEAATIWHQLAGFLSTARHRVLLVAPFVKAPIFEAVLRAIPADVEEIVCITRWKASEVASGVSDVEVLAVAEADPRVPHLFLRQDLHAKVYVCDDRCLVGSANLTGKATGLADPANVEVLVDVSVDEPSVIALLDLLSTGVQPATPELAASIRAQAALLRAHDLVPPGTPPDVGAAEVATRWYPTTRVPEQLWRIYSGDTKNCIQAVVEGALVDLAALGVDPGLDEGSFEQAVRDRLLAIEEVQEILDRGRMHGNDLEEAIRANGTEEEAAEYAMVLTRWLVHFLDDVQAVPSGEYEIIRTKLLH